MTSKQRVRNAMMHKPVDRVPAAFEAVGDDQYHVTITFPLNDVQTIEEVDAYDWPSTNWFDYTEVTRQCKAHPDQAIVIGHEGAFQQVTSITRKIRWKTLFSRWH